MLRRFVVASAIVGFAGVPMASAESNWLEPEDGVFSEGLRQNDLLLRAALLGDDHYRQCQLIAMPSFEPDNVVFIRDDDGEPTIVSRTLRPDFWSKPTTPEKKPAQKAGPRGERQDDIPPERLQAAAETKTARLDRAAADLVMGVCEEVLLRTRYPGEVARGFDGVTYHATHRGHGTFLSGKTWSPTPGTVAYGFVEMEKMLAAFATAPAAQRETARSTLLAKAKVLLKRVQKTPLPGAAESPAGRSAERAVEFVAILVKGVAAGKDASQMAGDFNAMLGVTNAKNRWMVDTDIPGIRISLGARSESRKVTEAVLYTDVMARLSMDDLQRRFGAYSVVRESKGSSARFTAVPANVEMVVDLLDDQVTAEAIVQRVTVRQDSSKSIRPPPKLR